MKLIFLFFLFNTTAYALPLCDLKTPSAAFEVKQSGETFKVYEYKLYVEGKLLSDSTSPTITRKGVFRALAKAIKDKTCTFRKLRCFKEMGDFIHLWSNTDIHAIDDDDNIFTLPDYNYTTPAGHIYDHTLSNNAINERNKNFKFYVDSGICQDAGSGSRREIDDSMRSISKDVTPAFRPARSSPQVQQQ